MNYRPRMEIKGQALTDFIAEFIYSDTIEATSMTSSAKVVKGVETKKGRTSTTKNEDNSDDVEQWTLYVDSASNENGSGAGMMLISLEGRKIHCSLRFGFQTSNNKAKYKAFIAGL